jgi:hypothetical protein
MQPKVLELRILNQFSRILLEDDDHTNDVVVVVVVDGDDDDDDNGPVELFQKRGKWWELIV